MNYLFINANNILVLRNYKWPVLRHYLLWSGSVNNGRSKKVILTTALLLQCSRCVCFGSWVLCIFISIQILKFYANLS